MSQRGKRDRHANPNGTDVGVTTQEIAEVITKSMVKNYLRSNNCIAHYRENRRSGIVAGLELKNAVTLFGLVHHYMTEWEPTASSDNEAANGDEEVEAAQGDENFIVAKQGFCAFLLVAFVRKLSVVYNQTTGKQKSMYFPLEHLPNGSKVAGPSFTKPAAPCLSQKVQSGDAKQVAVIVQVLQARGHPQDEGGRLILPATDSEVNEKLGLYLSGAVCNSQMDVVSLLLSSFRYDQNQLDIFLCAAVHQRDPQIFKLLLGSLEKPKRTPWVMVMLHICVGAIPWTSFAHDRIEERTLDLVEFLLDAEADDQVEDLDGQGNRIPNPPPGRARALQLLEPAACGGSLLIFNSLANRILDNSLLANYRDKTQGGTLAHTAVTHGSSRILRHLYGVRDLDPEVTDRNGQTALQSALVGRSAHIVYFFLTEVYNGKLTAEKLTTAIQSIPGEAGQILQWAEDESLFRQTVQ